MIRLFLSILIVATCSTANADEPGELWAYYLANSGVMIEQGLVLGWLRVNNELQLYGPEQAVAAIRRLVRKPDDKVLRRMHGITLENGGPATDIEIGALLIEAMRRFAMNISRHKQSIGRTGTHTWPCRPTGFSIRLRVAAY